MPGHKQKAEMSIGNVTSTNLHTGHVDGRSTSKNVGPNVAEQMHLAMDQRQAEDVAHKKMEEERHRAEMEAAERKKLEIETERERAGMAKKKQEEMEIKHREEKKRLEAEAERTRAEEERTRKSDTEARAASERKRLEAEDAERKKLEALAEQKKKAAEKSTDSRTTHQQGSPSRAGKFSVLKKSKSKVDNLYCGSKRSDRCRTATTTLPLFIGPHVKWLPHTGALT